MMPAPTSLLPAPSLARIWTTARFALFTAAMTVDVSDSTLTLDPSPGAGVTASIPVALIAAYVPPAPSNAAASDVARIRPTRPRPPDGELEPAVGVGADGGGWGAASAGWGSNHRSGVADP